LVRSDIDRSGGPPRSSAEVIVEDLDLMRPGTERKKVLPPGTLVDMAIDNDSRTSEPECPIETAEPGPQG
jgi:hypothetical protein